MMAILMMVCILSVPFSGIWGDSVYAQDYELPEDIQENKNSYDTIEGLIEKYEAEFAGRTPPATQYATKINGEQLIKRLNFYYPETPVEVNGGIYVDIPEEIARVVRLFGDIRYTGTIAENGNVKMYVVEPDGTENLMSNFGQAWQGEYKDAQGNPLWTSYGKTSGHPSALMNPTENKDENGEINYSGYKLKFEGTGNIAFICLWEENGLPAEYDVSAYSVMGGDKEIIQADVEVDATRNLSINGVNKMEEDVFKRFHVNSGPVQVFSNISDWILDDEVFSKTYRDWGFEPGRGTFQIKDANGLLTESENGYSDPTALYESYVLNSSMVNKLNTLFPSVGNDYVLTLDGWPRWQWGEFADINEKNLNMATPDDEYFDAAGDTAAQIVKAVDTRLGGYGPKYVEVKNESTFPGEWAYFTTYGDDVAWEKLAEFHNIVADSIKETNENVLVGGPSSAFMYLEADDFADAYHQLAFMDATKDSLDWYSHHFYENSNLYINGREDNSDGFLCGRFQAVMDLLRAHMANTDNVKPILITEEGSYNGFTSPSDLFQNLTAFNGYLLQSLEYADTIDMLVPYLYPVKSWEPNANHQLYKYNDTQTGILEEMTYLEAYVDLWKDFRGAYLPVEVSTGNDVFDSRIYTSAVRNGDTVYLAVQNLNDQRVNLDINAFLGSDVKIDSTRVKHYYLEKGELTYEEVNVDDINNFYMRVQEMAVFEIKLSEAPAFENELYQKIDYAKEELVDTGDKMEFTINTGLQDLESSVLRVGFGKSGSGFDGEMSVTINGIPVGTRSLEYTNKSGDVFTTIEFDVDTDILQEGENKVVLSMPEGGKVSSVQLTNYYCKETQKAADAKVIQDKITEAMELIGDKEICISETGTGVPQGYKWVKQVEYDSFINAIEDASILLKDVLLTEDEVNETLSTLQIAMEMWQENQKNPIIQIPGMDTISFEDGENTPIYTLSNTAKASMEIVGENASDGENALAVTITELNQNIAEYYSNKVVTFESPNQSIGWDVSQGFAMDIYNPSDIDQQFYIIISDTSGVKAWTWGYMVPANSTATISMTDFGPRTDWVNSFGMTNGIDAEHIKSIGIAAYESYQADAGAAEYTYYIDNIHSLGSQASDQENDFPNTTFEENEAVNYYVTTANSASSEFVTQGESRALKVTVPTMDTTWGKLSEVVWETTADTAWDFSQGAPEFDITNPNEYALPYVVKLVDENGNMSMYWLSVGAGETQHVDLRQVASISPNEADTSAITRFSIWINEPDPAMSGKTDVSFILDNVIANPQHIDPNPSEPEEDLVYAEKPQIDMIICHIVKDENLDRRCDICDKEILAKAPVLTSGNNAQWEQGSTTELTFISDAAYDDFIKVLVNGKHLASEQYAINGDVITLSLTPGYLSTLELGKYALEIVSSNGVAEGLFIITEADGNESGGNESGGNESSGNESGNTSTPESPSTSDTSHVIAISLLVVGSLLTVLFCGRKVKKT